MPAVGAQFGGTLGPLAAIKWIISNSGSAVYAMATLNTGCCVRFTAVSANDIKSVRLFWSSVATPGTVQLRIETIDTTTGKPTGTLYDANATYNITPAAGTQTYTFVTLPTTGLTAGTEYAVVLLTTVAGTTQTLSHNVYSLHTSSYPTIVLTAADGTTRSNFAEVAVSVPVCSLVDEADVDIALPFAPFSGANPSYSSFFSTTDFVAQKFTINTSINIAGIQTIFRRTGTPAGDIRIRIFDNSNNVVAGTTITIDKDSLTGVSTRQSSVLFPVVVTLPSGTYRVVYDSSGSANSSNCFGVYSVAFLHANAVNPWVTSTSADAITWTDSTTAQSSVWLLIDNLVAGGGGGMLVHPGMEGGMNG